MANGGFAITFNGANGGLLVNASGGSISGTGVVGGGTTGEFIVNVAGGDAFSITSPIVSSTATAGSLTKTGGGTLTVSAASAYTGSSIIAAGTLKLGLSDSTALGAATNSITVDNGETLDLNAEREDNYAMLYISGTGVGGVGAVTNSSATNITNNGMGNVTLQGNASIGGNSGRFDFLAGTTLYASGYTLTKIGTNYMAIKGATSDLNNLVINQGTWEISNATGLGNGTVTINSGATVSDYEFTGTYNNTFILNGGQIGGAGNTNQATLSGSITLGPASQVTSMAPKTRPTTKT